MADLSPTVSPDSSETPVAPKKRVFGGGVYHYPPYRSKVEDLLRDEHRAAYESMIVGNATLPTLHNWLNSQGYDFGKETVRRHREKFLRGVGEIRRGAEVAMQFAKFARAAGLTLDDAAVGGFHQMLMQFFTNAQVTTSLTGKDVQSVAAAIDSFIDTHQKVDNLRRDLSTESTSTIRNESDVVDRVREILGV